MTIIEFAQEIQCTIAVQFNPRIVPVQWEAYFENCILEKDPYGAEFVRGTGNTPGIALGDLAVKIRGRIIQRSYDTANRKSFAVPVDLAADSYYNGTQHA